MICAQASCPHVTVFRIIVNVNYNCFKIRYQNEEIKVSLVKIRADCLGGSEKRREWQRMVKIDTD